MIKAEVVFDGEAILCNGIEIEISIHEDYDKFYVVGKKVFPGLEQAIAYCLQQQSK